jgi:drug/metabolite transporter (DMT)-like permease
MAALLGLASSVLWGAADFLGGTAARRRVTWQVVVWSQTIAAVVLVALVLATGAWRDVSIGAWTLWALMAGATGMAGLLSFYAALAQGTMGVVSPIAAMGVLVPLAVGLAAGEHLSRIHAYGVAAAVVGIVLASGPELTARSPWRPVLLAGVAALCFGFAIVGVARGSQVSVLMTMLVMRVFSFVIFVVALIVTPSVRSLQRGEFWPLLTVGILDVAANIAYGFATRIEALAIVSVLGSIYPIVTVALARFVHKEKLEPVQYFGVAAAMTGVALISL